MREPGVHEIEQAWVTTPDGVRLCAYRLGRGKQAVVVLNALYLLEQLAWLGREYTVVAYDPRNRGRSQTVADRALLHRGVHHDAEDLETICRAFSLRRPHVVAHSYLAVAALLYAVAQPELLGRIVALAPAEIARVRAAAAPRPPAGGGPRPEAAIAVLARLPEAETLRRLRAEGADRNEPRAYCEAWLQLMAHAWLAEPARISELAHVCAFANEWPQRLESHLRRNVRPSLERLDLRREDLALVRSPVLVVRGERDPLCPEPVAAGWAALLPEARLLRVRAGRHMPWIDAPGVMQPALEQFLGGSWPLGSEAVV